MIVHCSNPTCAAVLRNSELQPLDVPVVYPELLAAFGWDVTDVDGRPEPICGRCRRDG